MMEAVGSISLMAGFHSILMQGAPVLSSADMVVLSLAK
jgi:hypothetical protein